jgi:hypothetical protein
VGALVRRASCTAAIAVLVFASAAQGADTAAPAGAGVNWLPHEDWVIRHWVPFEERALYSILRVSRGTVFHWLADHDRTIASLAGARGLTARRLADRLVTRGAGGARRGLLRSRTLRTLTQSHLARHLLFHVFHNRRIGFDAPRIFGVGWSRWWHMRRSGHTVLEVARCGRRTVTHARRMLWRTLVREQRIGVARELTSPSQARRLLGEQRRELPSWFGRNRLRVPEWGLAVRPR